MSASVRERAHIRVIVAVCVVLLMSVVLAPASDANAANSSEFHPGYLISDADFYDPDAMTEGDIQAFLDAHTRPCHNSNCLNVLRVDTFDRAANAPCREYKGRQGERASSVLFKVQQACGISAKVLLVTLQKEQGLIGKVAPTDLELRKAMGYGCPDTAACDSRYYGFYNQVYNAAWQFGWYRIGFSTPGSSFYGKMPPGQVSQVRYHPNAGCGTGPVMIHNFATAALYHYTPYQPNGAALSNLYGVGDGCSSYGNRNFWRIFTDWFGPTGSMGALRIDQAHEFTGGDGGWLGKPVTGVNEFSANGGGLVRGYENGAIAWSAGYGAYAVSGSVRSKYNASGGLEGYLGWPASWANTIPARGGGVVQAFQGGAIASSATFGSHVITGATRHLFNELGGIAAGPGWPTSDSECSAGTCVQTFEGGAIYESQSHGARFLTSTTNAFYQSLGAAGSSLGLPLSSSNALSAHGGGTVTAFEHGAVADSSHGIFVVAGDIRRGLSEAGGIGGKAGWPTSAQQCSDSTCWQDFEGGRIYVHSGGAPVLVLPMFRDFIDAGYDVAVLGVPTHSSVAIAAHGVEGLVQPLASAALVWSPVGGLHVVHGDMRTLFNREGGIAGTPGWPTSGIDCELDWCTQSFSGLTLMRSGSGEYALLPEIAKAYRDNGGPGGVLGVPQSGPIAFVEAGGGHVQVFEHGAIAQSERGAFAVHGALRAFFNELGGIANGPGWPRGPVSCGDDGVCRQPFDRQTLVWSPAEGGKVE